jgi:signal transduction histidine kinase/CheY-like chemotaxis protein
MGQRGPIYCRRKDGTRFPAEASIFHVERDRRKLATAIVRDITERKRLEENFLQAQKLEAVGRVAATVAHDFNNLLAAIQIHAELVRGAASLEDVAAEAEGIRTATERGSALVRQLLVFSRHQGWRPSIVDVSDAIGEMQTMLARLVGPAVRTEFVMNREAGATIIDGGQLAQILVNLAVNARDAMPAGGVLRIATDSMQISGDQARRFGVRSGRYARILVSDTGVGMDEATVSRLFEPFFTTKSPGKGTGLGLASVWAVVRQAGGTVRVSSRVSEGSVFEIYLPRVEPEATIDDTPAETDLVPVALEAVTGRRAKGTVLVVDDDEQLLPLLVRGLRRSGFEVLQARGVGEAIAICDGRPGPIDVLLTDIAMRYVSGIELAQRMKRFRPETKVILMSGFASEDVLAAAREQAIPFIQKPFALGQLVERVRRLVD